MKLQLICKEQGRGKGDVIPLRDLRHAQQVIRSYWQGMSYRDGPDGFHTDYSTFKCVGFKLSDVVRSGWTRDDPDGIWDTVWVDLGPADEHDEAILEDMKRDAEAQIDWRMSCE